jgi:hypothetical protein
MIGVVVNFVHHFPKTLDINIPKEKNLAHLCNLLLFFMIQNLLNTYLGST